MKEQGEVLNTFQCDNTAGISQRDFKLLLRRLRRPAEYMDPHNPEQEVAEQILRSTDGKFFISVREGVVKLSDANQADRPEGQTSFAMADGWDLEMQRALVLLSKGKW